MAHSTAGESRNLNLNVVWALSRSGIFWYILEFLSPGLDSLPCWLCNVDAHLSGRYPHHVIDTRGQDQRASRASREWKVHRKRRRQVGGTAGGEIKDEWLTGGRQDQRIFNDSRCYGRHGRCYVLIAKNIYGPTCLKTYYCRGVAALCVRTFVQSKQVVLRHWSPTAICQAGFQVDRQATRRDSTSDTTSNCSIVGDTDRRMLRSWRSTAK